MPPTGAETKVQDPEYKNWLRVGLALYYLKNALHFFLQTEVDAMHQSILQKLYGCSAVPKPQCSSCKFSDVKQNRNTHIWKFHPPCPSNLCDAWLTKLMTFHTNPTSKKICWENCDVTAWPFVPWECAKLYMPRGQPPANTGPAMSDSQALLTLMTSCTYLHVKLSPAGLTLVQEVSKIRNRVMHSGDMRLSDSERKSFIQDMIRFLEDPTHIGSLKECKQAVEEINRLHMIALKTAVNEVRQELGMQGERTLNTVESLKEEYRQLTEQLTGKLKAIETRIDTTERGVQLVIEQTDIALQKQEKKHQEMYKTVTSYRDRLHTVQEDVEYIYIRMDSIESNVHSVQEHTDSALQEQEKKYQEMYSTVTSQLTQISEDVENRMDTAEREIQSVKGHTDTALQQQEKLSLSMETMSASIATHGIRLDAVEENVHSLGTKLQEFETVKVQTDTALQQQVKLSETMETMSASANMHGVRLDVVEENLVKLQEIGQRTGQHDKKLRKLDKEIQEVKAITSRATDQVSAESIESDISKLRDDLIKVYKNLRCVQVSPIFEKKRCDIDNIYVDLVIEEKEHRRKTEKKSKYVSNRCKDAQSYSRKVIRVTSYKQIFLDERGSKFKRVYLRGKGGLGKTTFCRNVLHSWCNAHEGRAIAKDGYFQDEAVLQIFDLLFFVNLRDVSVDENLVEAICDKFRFLSPRKNFLETMLYLNGEKVLFILDGLDEMIVQAGFIENVVTHRDYPNCCFLVSSRPWKIYQMELQVGIEIDLLLDLEGFSEKNAIKFAENIFRNCYNDGNAIEQFEKDVGNNEVATQLIHVPLLLLFLTHMWYVKRSLPRKLHELYICFLNLMADQMKEKYKKDPNHRQMRFTLGDSWSLFPSKISETSLVVNFGEGFLLSLCEVAHHFLLSSEKENSLVFEETKLLNALGDKGKEKLDVALDLGILSVTDSVSYLKRNTSVSFVHKTIQEFFTALYFILNPDKLANFIASIADLNDVLQNEYIIIFLVGLMPKLGNEVLEKVSELCKGVWETFRSGEGPDLPQRFRLNGISKIYLRCKEEIIGEDVLLNVWGLSLNTNNFDLHSWNPPFLQSLDLFTELRGVRCIVNEKYVNLSELTGLIYLRLEYLNLSSLPESGSLSVLSMEGVILSSSCCDLLGSTLAHCTKLERLKIHTTDLQNGLLDLSNMTELAVLDMFCVTLSSSCCDVLSSTLTHCIKLRKLMIHMTDLHNCLLDLSNMTELTILDLSEVTLSSSCCDVLGSTLILCTKLKILKIHKTNLHNCLLHLSTMTELTDLDLSEVTLSSSCFDVLDNTLTGCTKLKILKIHKTNLQNCLLDLSNMTDLIDLDMSEITLSSSCCDVLGSTLTHCTKLQTLKIHKTNLHDCLLDLFNMTELTYLDMSEITLSSICCSLLGSTLTNCTKLKALKINNMDLQNCLLHLSNMTELTDLDMSEVALSCSCCDVFGSTLSNCTKLKTLNIHRTNLHNCLLDVSNMTELIYVAISEVTLSSSCCDVLGRTLTHCTKLELLSICNIDLHNCLLDVSNMTDLTDLDISEVTLSRSCCEVLGSTLTHCAKLKTLKIYNTDLHNCVLDLSNMTELTYLEMLRVTLSSSCCDVLGSTLTQCAKLKTLKIRNTDLHNCQLDLSDMTELSNLVILEVILSSSACQVLELSLDQLKAVKEDFCKYTCEKSPCDNDKWKVKLAVPGFHLQLDARNYYSGHLEDIFIAIPPEWMNILKRGDPLVISKK